jgi:hypothetical protein
VWQRKGVKTNKEQHWFKIWITKNYTMKDISEQSGYSHSKIKRIIYYWLSQEVPVLLNVNYQSIKYVLFDGTYFHKDGCLIVFIDNETGKPFYYDYVTKESYETVYPITCHLKDLGLNPKTFTLDGHPGVIKALLDTWSTITIQRCLFHIQNQGLMWIRKPPKTQIGYYLSEILKSCGSMKTQIDMTSFLDRYCKWRNNYKEEIASLKKTSIAYKDLKRTMTLIDNALKDMFHFIKDQKIAPTTNFIECFFKHLKHKYRGHQGLSLKHKIAFLKWYCFYKN